MNQPRIFTAKCSASDSCNSQLGKWEMRLFGGNEIYRYLWTEQVVAFTAEDAVVQLRVKYEAPANDPGGYLYQFGKHLRQFSVDEIAPDVGER